MNIVPGRCFTVQIWVTIWKEVVETEDCKVLRMNDPSGDGLMTIYRVFDGVYLIYNDFHMSHCYSRFNSLSLYLLH